MPYRNDDPPSLLWLFIYLAGMFWLALILSGVIWAFSWLLDAIMRLF